MSTLVSPTASVAPLGQSGISAGASAARVRLRTRRVAFMEAGPWWDVDSSEQGEHIVHGVVVNHVSAEPSIARDSRGATQCTCCRVIFCDPSRRNDFPPALTWYSFEEGGSPAPDPPGFSCLH